MINLNERNKGSENLLGVPKLEADAKKITGESVTRALQEIHRAIAQFLNQANKNVLTFFDHIKRKIKDQNVELVSISSSINQTKKAYDRLTDQIHRLEYKIRNLQFKRPNITSEQPQVRKLSAGALGLLAMLVGSKIAKFLTALGLGTIGTIAAVKLYNWYTQQSEQKEPEVKPDEAPTEKEEQPDEPPTTEQPVVELPEVQVEAKTPIAASDNIFKLSKSLVDLSATTIDMRSENNIDFQAKKIHFKADEILIDSPKILLTSNIIVDGSVKISPVSPPTPSPVQRSAVPDRAPRQPTEEDTSGATESEEGASTPQEGASTPQEGASAPTETQSTEPAPQQTQPEPTPEPAGPMQFADVPNWRDRETINKPAPIDPKWETLHGETENIEDRRQEGIPIGRTLLKNFVTDQSVEEIAKSIRHPFTPHEQLQSPQYPKEAIEQANNPTGTLGKSLGVEQIKAGPISPGMVATPLHATQSPPEFRLQFKEGSLAHWASSGTGVFKPGMMTNYAQQAAQKTVEKMPREKYERLPPDVKQHIQAALEGRGNYDANFVFRRTAPTMTRKELEQTKKEMSESGIRVIEPEGWKTPDEQPQPTQQQPTQQPSTGATQSGTSPEQSQQASPAESTPSSTSPVDAPRPSQDAQSLEPAQPQQQPQTSQTQQTPQAPETAPSQSQSGPPDSGPVTTDPEREPGRAASGSYGGMKSSIDHNSGICII